MYIHVSHERVLVILCLSHANFCSKLVNKINQKTLCNLYPLLTHYLHGIVIILVILQHHISNIILVPMQGCENVEFYCNREPI